MIRNSILILSTVFFASSCKSPERALICNEVSKYQVNETEACVTSVKHNACFCAKFDVNTWNTLEDFREEPLDYCDGFIGVKNKFGIEEIQPKFKALQRLRTESCRKIKKDLSKISNKNI